MTPSEYRDLLKSAGLSQVGAARLFRVNPKTSRRWANEKNPQDIPAAVEITLRMMVRFSVSAEEATAMVSAGPANEVE